jgi:hypothetical protein
VSQTAQPIDEPSARHSSPRDELTCQIGQLPRESRPLDQEL